PARRGARLVAAGVLVAAAGSAILAVILVPLAVLRVHARRDRTTLATAGAFLVVLAGQVIPNVLGINPRGDISHPRFNPVWALGEYATWALPRQILGQRWSGVPSLTPTGQLLPNGNITHPAVTVAAWAVLAAAVVVAALRLT